MYAKTSKVACEMFQKGVRLQLERFPFLHNSKFFVKMMTEDDVHLQLWMRLQLGILR